MSSTTRDLWEAPEPFGFSVPLYEGTRRRVSVPDDAEHKSGARRFVELNDPGPLGGSRAIRLLSSTARDLCEAPVPLGPSVTPRLLSHAAEASNGLPYSFAPVRPRVPIQEVSR